ncbi:MAG: DUF2844 domain-containing protein [Proteobacteria bacterium]|nr:MAG: DUF2844 domain-containing protein [Pseudomonadota bacterium]
MTFIHALLFVFATAGSSWAHAALGERSTSVKQDVTSLKAAQKVSTSKNDYTIHEMVADGNTIKEFSNRDGLVFAVSWRGISKPDLSILFGSYYGEYMASIDRAEKQHGRRSVSVQTNRMVVKRGGRMRDQRGFAVVPSLVPEGLSLEGLDQ